MKSRELGPEYWMQSVARYASASGPKVPLNLKSGSQFSTELWPKIDFDHIWWSVSHLELDDFDKKS